MSGVTSCCRLLLLPIYLLLFAGTLVGIDDGVVLQGVLLVLAVPLALAIAVVAFPDRPLIPLALVVGPLIELPVLAVVAQALRATVSGWIGGRTPGDPMKSQLHSSIRAVPGTSGWSPRRGCRTPCWDGHSGSAVRGLPPENWSR